MHGRTTSVTLYTHWPQVDYEMGLGALGDNKRKIRELVYHDRAVGALQGKILLQINFRRKFQVSPLSNKI